MCLHLLLEWTSLLPGRPTKNGSAVVYKSWRENLTCWEDVLLYLSPGFIYSIGQLCLVPPFHDTRPRMRGVRAYLVIKRRTFQVNPRKLYFYW